MKSKNYDQRVRADFSRAAAQYDTHASLQRDVVDATYHQLLPHLMHDAQVLDAGCGTAYLARTLKEKHIGWHIFSLDSAEGMCRKAAQPHSICGDMTSLPLKDECVDAVFSSLALQWTEAPQAAFKEWHRVTKPRGFAAVATLGPATLRELRECMVAAGMPESVLPFRPIAALEADIKGAGWRIISSSASQRRETYTDTNALLRQLKGLGATYKSGPVLKPAQLTALKDVYQTRAKHGKNVYATFEIITMLLTK